MGQINTFGDTLPEDDEKIDEVLIIEANQISEQDIDNMESDWERRQELMQEGREEPFYAWAESLTAEELMEQANVTKKEFIGQYKEELMTSFNEID